MSKPKLTEMKEDEDLKKAKAKVLADLLGRKVKEKSDWSNRELTSAQKSALHFLEEGTAFEVIEKTIEYGDDKVDPITKQVRPYGKKKGLVVTLELDPQSKQWLEHLMKALVKTPLKKSEIELFKKHMRRLNYEGALKDYYEFYGLTLRELEDKEKEYRDHGATKQADRIRDIIEKNK